LNFTNPLKFEFLKFVKICINSLTFMVLIKLPPMSLFQTFSCTSNEAMKNAMMANKLALAIVLCAKCLTWCLSGLKMKNFMQEGHGKDINHVWKQIFASSQHNPAVNSKKDENWRFGIFLFSLLLFFCADLTFVLSSSFLFIAAKSCFLHHHLMRMWFSCGNDKDFH